VTFEGEYSYFLTGCNGRLPGVCIKYGRLEGAIGVDIAIYIYISGCREHLTINNCQCQLEKEIQKREGTEPV
jgi:hypothetical protein